MNATTQLPIKVRCAERFVAQQARECLWLLRGELFQLRTTWFWYLVMMSFTPLVTVAFLWFFSGSSPGALQFIITGSITTAISTSAMLTLGQDIGQMKDAGRFEYYASLPISKSTFILALATRSMILALPSPLILLAIGALAFGMPVSISPVVAIVFALSGFSLAGLGAFIGFFSREGRIAGLVTQMVNPLITFLAPVYTAHENLPGVLQRTSQFLPTTYAARALRASISGAVTRQTWLDIGFLALWTVVTLTLASSRLSWRASE